MKKIFVIFVMFLTLSFPFIASADTFTFTFDGPSINATGTLNAIDNGNGSFTAISGSGMANGIAMTLFLNPLGTGQAISPANNFYFDNQLFPAATSLIDTNGLLFTAATSPAWPLLVGATEISFYSQGTSYAYYDKNPNTGFNGEDGIFTLTAATPTSAVPEPATILLLGLGLMGLTGVRRKFKK